MSTTIEQKEVVSEEKEVTPSGNSVANLRSAISTAITVAQGALDEV